MPVPANDDIALDFDVDNTSNDRERRDPFMDDEMKLVVVDTAAESVYYCDCPYPFYGEGCDKETYEDPCDGVNCNGGICKPARSGGSAELLFPFEDVGAWDAFICICPYSPEDDLCHSDRFCRSPISCADVRGTKSCVQPYNVWTDMLDPNDPNTFSWDTPEDVYSKEGTCRPETSNMYCQGPLETDGDDEPVDALVADASASKK